MYIASGLVFLLGYLWTELYVTKKIVQIQHHLQGSQTALEDQPLQKTVDPQPLRSDAAGSKE